MTEEEKTEILKRELLTVAEALRPCMPRVADLMDDASQQIDRLLAELDKIFHHTEY